MSAEQYGAYSVLMSVYSKENPTWLRLAIESMQTQTLPTSDSFWYVMDTDPSGLA